MLIQKNSLNFISLAMLWNKKLGTICWYDIVALARVLKEKYLNFFFKIAW